MKSSIPNFSQIFQPNHRTLKGSFKLYQRRFLRPNTHFAAFFEIYKILTPLHRSKLKIFANFCQTFSYFCWNLCKNRDFFSNFHRILHKFQWEFLRISMNNLENVDKSSNFWISDEFWQNFLNSERISTRILMFKRLKFDWFDRWPIELFNSEEETSCFLKN